MAPYEYTHIQQQIKQLINVYKTNQDKAMITVTQEQTKAAMLPIIGEELHNSIESLYLDKSLTNAKAEGIYQLLLTHVTPFKRPSDKQIDKHFRKVKKLKYPVIQDPDLYRINFLAWDDTGSNRKYLMLYQEDRLVGLYGTMSTTVIQSACAICHKIDAVSLFMTTTKQSGDGTYTKKGNYICKDSQRCNRQMETREFLDDFYHTVSR